MTIMYQLDWCLGSTPTPNVSPCQLWPS